MGREFRIVRTGERGAVAVTFILFSILLLGFVAFALDVGRLYVSKAELQNAADSCALAAAGALTGSNLNQLQAAEDYGVTAGSRNLISMQAAPAPVTAADITFSQALNGPFKARGDVASADVLKMRYVKCLLTEEDINPLMIQVLNLLEGQHAGPSLVRASAVAGLEPSKSNCALPLAICSADVAGAGGSGWADPGKWIQGVFENNQNIQGAFKWVQFTGKESNKQFEDMLSGAGMCDLNKYDKVSSGPGGRESLNTAWNSRFGIYKSGAGNPSPADAIPDGTGWIYDPDYTPKQLPASGLAQNAYDEFIAKRSSLVKHQTTTDYKFPGGSYSWTGDGNFNPNSSRRLVTGPIVDCNQLAKNGTADIIDWACYLMLKPALKNGVTVWLEFRGLASDPSAGCVTSGAPGGSGAGGPKVPTLVQ